MAKQAAEPKRQVSKMAKTDFEAKSKIARRATLSRKLEETASHHGQAGQPGPRRPDAISIRNRAKQISIRNLFLPEGPPWIENWRKLLRTMAKQARQGQARLTQFLLEIAQSRFL